MSTETMMNTIKNIVNETADKTLLNNNANKNHKILPVQRDMIAGEVNKELALQSLPPEVAAAHLNGDIHFHDLDYSYQKMWNCTLINFKRMLKNGFEMGNAKIETPRSFSVACAVCTQIIAQVTSHVYGGTTFNRMDEVLSEYAKLSHDKHIKIVDDMFKESGVTLSEEELDKKAWNLTVREIKSGVQAYEYEVNTIYSSNGQTPFHTVNFGLGTDRFAREIQIAILETRMLGLGKNHKTAIFPKLVFTLKHGVNMDEGDPNYDIKELAAKCAAQRIYPDVIHYDNIVKITGHFTAPMGCRSFLSALSDENGNEIIDGRNNLGVVSLNLPRIAILANGDMTTFWNLLDERLELCKTALMARIHHFDNVKASCAPILYCSGSLGVDLKPDDYVADVFKNGFSSISLGYIGIHETVTALFGDHDKRHTFDSKQKQELGKKIVQRLRDAAELWKKETGYGYSLYSTPAESLCDRFCRLDRNKFGYIVGVTDHEYYTNSFHLDVAKHVAPDQKLLFEHEYQYIANGGFISYAECDCCMIGFEKAIMSLWDYGESIGTGYMGINGKIDQCTCGWRGKALINENGFYCPECGTHDPKKLNVCLRVCGYLGNPAERGFIHGKQHEVINRYGHINKSILKKDNE